MIYQECQALLADLAQHKCVIAVCPETVDKFEVAPSDLNDLKENLNRVCEDGFLKFYWFTTHATKRALLMDWEIKHGMVYLILQLVDK